MSHFTTQFKQKMHAVMFTSLTISPSALYGAETADFQCRTGEREQVNILAHEQKG